MEYYATIDTNVLVDGLLRENSPSGFLLEFVFFKKIVPILNKEILREYVSVLSRPKFQFDPDHLHHIIWGLIKLSLKIDYPELTAELGNFEDQIFYEVVYESQNYQKTNSITGNFNQFTKKKMTVTPFRMLKLCFDDPDVEMDFPLILDTEKGEHEVFEDIEELDITTLSFDELENLRSLFSIMHLNEQAAENGVADISLEEINAEIELARKEMAKG